METKLCGRCKEVLPLSSFHKCSRERSGLQQWCKDCRKGHKYEERKVYHRERYRDNKEAYRDYTYKRKYRISLVEYQLLLESQKGVCAICGTKSCPSGKRFAVDHCHTTGKVRGLLCMECNNGIGKLKDSVELLEKAMVYLKKYGE